MQDRQAQFLDLSTALTGFSSFELLGTAVVGDHLASLDSTLPAGVVDELLAAFAALPAGVDRDDAVAREIMDNPKLGPVASALIVAWYTGAWPSLSSDWQKTYGALRKAGTFVVSGAAYLAGLEWVAIGSHPPGGLQQGFGAWSLAPQRSGS
jgi:hypothetical protein